MKTGIIFGVFDLLHVGHIVTLEQARRQCDYLIVGLKADADETAQDESQPAQTVVERFIKLEGCQYVDEIIPYESDDDIVDILQSLTVDVHFVGEEQALYDFPGKAYCMKEGIELIYIKRKHRFSSQGLRKTVSQKEQQKAFQIKTIN
ncbi:glycerol-3-phosphate cytidylyltransferase [Sphingobacterium alkalisoli]|uniref:Glycerol-3-phosphate cytidylyltransferase n=1 Tax=Sphingobacterium alkalisoli TaxID=1874115 RepID=A0A4U0GWK1_9SPHI|nr:adenylyltransferase/cytidyltransferase family protein [Sphingobacterium alkalisoli]TJY63463.1 glycerol-3-phosphate cytidylyltransferase [Sphingobacterium alkalisoli]GGH26220.1 glycerol-3-phosphate cytidylyltransferase [Sphingobacterium alkalisoli]